MRATNSSGFLSARTLFRSALFLMVLATASCATGPQRGDVSDLTVADGQVVTPRNINEIDAEEILGSDAAQERAPEELAALREAFDDYVDGLNRGARGSEIEELRADYAAKLREAFAKAQFARNVVAVLPPEEGEDVGGVEVSSGGQSVLLDEPYEAVSLDFVGYVLPTTALPEDVDANFQTSLNAEPIYANEYNVYFASGSTALNDAARALVDQIALDIVERKATELVLEGYSDPSGPADLNRVISQRRAEAVRDALLARDLPPLLVTLEAFGEDRVGEYDASEFETERRVFVQVR